VTDIALRDTRIYATGETESTDFPVTPGAFQKVCAVATRGCADAFVTQLNHDGSALIYSTFPTKCPIQVANAGNIDVFVSKLNEAGNHLVFSTYLCGAQNDLGLRIRVDSRRAAYVAGSSASSNFPATPGALQTTYGGGGRDGFVTKICILPCP
jgi:hypothetical protein